MTEASDILEISNYYRVLGTNSNASDELIKQRYLERVREFPPEQSPEAFKKIREAYDNLKDPFDRSEYDLHNKYQGKPLKLLSEAIYYMEMANYKEAESLFEEAQKLAANNLYILRLKAKLALFKNNYSQFESLFEKIEGLVPKSKGFLFLINKAMLLLELEEGRRIIKVLKKMEDLFPEQQAKIAYIYLSAHEFLDDFSQIWQPLSKALPLLDDLDQHFEFFIDIICFLNGYEKYEKKEELFEFASDYVEMIKDNEEAKEALLEILKEKIEEARYHGDAQSQLFFKEILLEFVEESELGFEKQKIERIAQIDQELDILFESDRASPFIFYQLAELFFDWAYDADPEKFMELPPPHMLKEVAEEHIWNVSTIDYLAENEFEIYELFKEECMQIREDSYNSLSEKELALFKKRLKVDSNSDYKRLDSGQVVKKEDVGRNDPCPCGSGKKHKKCCL